MPTSTNGTSENLVQAVTDVSDRVSNLVREEFELAKAEVTIKAKSLLRGTVAIFAGAVFGVFAVFIGLEAAAWALNAILVPGAGSIWEGFLIVFGVLALLAIGVVPIRLDQAEGRGAACPDDGDRRGQADPRDGLVQDGDRKRELMAAARSPEQIRASIEQNRQELGQSLDKLRAEVTELTDWRGQIRRHQREVLIGVGIAGFVLGGGLAALGALTFGRGRRRQLNR